VYVVTSVVVALLGRQLSKALKLSQVDISSLKEKSTAAKYMVCVIFICRAASGFIVAGVIWGGVSPAFAFNSSSQPEYV
jgi:hypothetical protein